MLKVDRKKVLQQLQRARAAELRRRARPPRKSLQEATRRIKATQKQVAHQLAEIAKGTLPEEYSYLERRGLRDYDFHQITEAIKILEVTTSNEIDVHRTPFTRIAGLLGHT